MSKKSRRSKSKRHARSVKPIQAKPSKTAELQSQAKISYEAQDSTSRYQYVTPELKRIGILAGSMILILIILSFVL